MCKITFRLRLIVTLPFVKALAACLAALALLLA